MNSSASGRPRGAIVPGTYDVWATHAWQYICKDAMAVSHGGAIVY